MSEENESKSLLSGFQSRSDSTASIGEKRLCQVFNSSNVNWLTYLLVILFGLGSWIAVNGVWVELPLLVDSAPESWDLPSYLTIIIQLANIGPLAYSLGNQKLSRFVTEKCTILFIIAIGATSCLLLVFFWDKTSYIGDVQHSTALLVLCFCVAIVDCTSSVVFLTFMAMFGPVYMSALFVGEAMSGLLPGIVAFIQGIGDNKKCGNSTEHLNGTSLDLMQNKTPGLRFGPSEFFIFLFIMMCLCGISFIALNHLASKRNILNPLHRSTVDLIDDKERHDIEHSTVLSDEFTDSAPILSRMRPSPEHIDGMVDHSIVYQYDIQHSIGQKQVIFLLCILMWINCLANGVLPSIQAYACEPYGEEAYHLVAILSSMTSTCTCLLAIWLPTKSSYLVFIYSIFYTITSAFIIVLASLSPTPPMYQDTVGAILVVAVCVINSALVSYIKLAISTIMHGKGQRALFWCGVSIQVGSCVGALTIFPLVNILKLFHQANPC